MHITITGNLGSGKSTIAKLLGEKYQFEIYSTGKVQRELARQMNMSTLELNQLMLSDRKYDKMIDDETARISRENRDKDIIFDSRLAWHFVEHSFKVFVSVSLDTAAERIMKDQRGAEERYSSLEEAKELLAKRAGTESIRYKEIYNLNYMDFSNYDLVIDSTYCTPDIIAEIILKEAGEYWENPDRGSRMLVSPKRLVFDDMFKTDEDGVLLMSPKLENTSYDTIKAIKVKKQEDHYLVIEDQDLAMAAVRADLRYIRIEVVKE